MQQQHQKQEEEQRTNTSKATNTALHSPSTLPPSQNHQLLSSTGEKVDDATRLRPATTPETPLHEATQLFGESLFRLDASTWIHPTGEAGCGERCKELCVNNILQPLGVGVGGGA